MANFSLLAKLGLDSKGFQTGLKGAQGRVNKFGRSITKLSNRLAKMGFATASAAFVLFSRRALQSANAVDKAADRLGVTTDEFQNFTNAAKAADIETRAAEMGLQRFTRRLGEAQQGSGELKDTLEKYNIAIRNSDGSARSASAVLGDLANAIKGAESPAEQLRIAFKAFDSEGADLVRILKDGEEGFKDFSRVGNEEFGRFEEGTIEALSRADKAIRAFKSKATIKVGELIAFEADGAAFKILGEKFLQVVGTFGIKLASQVVKTALLIPKTIGAAFEAALSGATGGRKGKDFQDNMEEFLSMDNNLFEGFTKRAKERSDERIELLEKEIEIARKLQKELDAAGASSSGGENNFFDDLPTGGGSGGDVDSDDEAKNEREQKAREDAFIAAKELEALELRAAGKNEQAEALEKQIELMKEAMRISQEYGISLEKAAALVRGIEANKPKEDDGGDGGGNGAEDTRGDFARELEGEALRKAANEAGKDDDIRFNRMADGSFQQFVDGKKGEKFTEDQLQKGLEKKIEKDPTEATLKSIEEILQGKFVNE